MSINTTATQLGDEWVINGSKSWITASGKADGYLIAARTSLNSRSRDISLFYIDASTEGLEADIGSHMIGLNSCPTGHITFTNCRIPLGNIIGSENQGYTLFEADFAARQTRRFGNSHRHSRTRARACK